MTCSSKKNLPSSHVAVVDGMFSPTHRTLQIFEHPGIKLDDLDSVITFEEDSSISPAPIFIRGCGVLAVQRT